MLASLNKIAKDVESLLAADEFPASVEPAYLRDAVRDYPLRGGKRLRPAILTWCCGLLGGDVEKTRYPAAAVEVFHNWTLVHDDIIDDDAFRRNAPTSHIALAAALRKNFILTEEVAATFGRNFAILTGDLQQGWANDLLLRSVEHGVEPAVAVELARLFQQKANAALISGEALDVELSLRPLAEVKIPEIVKMFLLKTGALLEFAALAGGMIARNRPGCANDPEIRKLGEFAQDIGVAFQLRDDYLGLFGDAKLGKPIGADLRESKATVLLLTALSHLKAEDRTKLENMLGKESYTEADLETARDLVRESGAPAMIDAAVERRVGQAREILLSFPENEYREYLHQMLIYLIDREK